ncbi:VanW family protein [Nocardioides sp. Root190]|uniref:VanW family protein n=1 Tax=Nocardioides sp. Root190 TaxID=1736488 RepID=UPI000AB33D22|nr:VanW family protein [Nocardioides sp. Root190]
MTTWDPAPDEKRERPGGKAVVVVVAVLLVLVGGGYVAAHALAGDKVPRGTTISGVDVGGLSRSAAISTLEEAFESRETQPIDVTVKASLAGSEANGSALKPSELGLSVDYPASVDAAGAGSSWSPGRQWDYFAGGGDVDAVVDVDESLLDTRLDELSKGLGTAPKDGQVTFSADGVRTVDPVRGDAVDRDAAREALTEAFLTEDDAVSLEVVKSDPDIDAADVARAVEEFADPAMAHPVTLVFGDSDVSLSPRQFAKALSMEPEDGVLVPVVDEAVLTTLVKGVTTDGEPVDATVRIAKGKPRIVPAKPGVEFDPAQVAEVFTGLLTGDEGERSGKVDAEVTEADFTTQDARDLKIVEKISEFTTRYPHADYRNINIGRAAKLVDGTLLKPGEEFSLNGIVGERTAENGFTEGYVISNGILKKDLGGGVSQMATTTFNAMFFAGLKDIQHKPHSFYIDRYPVGREATVAWPTVDLRFENDSEYGVLVRAWVEPSNFSRQGTVTVQMWSTKVWDIDSRTSNRYAYVPPATRTLTTADCESFTGYSGFQIDVTRIFRKHGQSAVDHTEKFHTVYTPADSVVCKKPGPPPEQDPDEG